MNLASDTVHDRLRDQVLSGALEPGDPVPSERELAAQLGVNRHAVREAIKRLQQAGLVQVSQGGATRVLDWRESGGLDLLLDVALARGGAVDGGTLRAIGEMRACIGVDAARLCALRATAEERREIADMAELVAAELSTDANERLWDALVAGSGNLAYRLALNTLLTGMERLPELAAHLAPARADSRRLRELAQALREGNGEKAASAVRPQLERPLRALARAGAPDAQRPAA